MTQPSTAPRETVDALLSRLDRIAAAGETLRAMTGHTGGTTSPSLPALLRDLERDLLIASRDVVTVRDSLHTR
jgi:hypothetical protein